MPAVREHALSNGMTLLCAPQNHLHSIVFGLYFKGGPLFEQAETQGISHFMEHLCFRALGGLDAIALNAALDQMGSELEAETCMDSISFRLKTHPRFFDNATDLFLRFFADIPWNESQILKAANVVSRQIEQQEGVGFDDIVECSWRDTGSGAFPVMGNLRTVASFTPALVRTWQQKIFQPQNAVLCLTGNFSAGMEDALIQAFGELANTTPEKPFEHSAPIGFGMRDTQSDLVIEAEGGQACVHIGFDIDSSLVYSPLDDVLSAITGEDNDSLLFQVLREDEGLVAEIESCIEQQGPFKRLAIRYDVRQDYLKESLVKVFDLLHRLSLYVRPARLDSTRIQFTGNLVFYDDDATAMNDLMGHAALSGDTSSADLEARAQMYQELSAEDLLNAAQSVFRPENLIISVQHDPKESGIRSMGQLLQKLRNTLS